MLVEVRPNSIDGCSPQGTRQSYRRPHPWGCACWVGEELFTNTSKGFFANRCGGVDSVFLSAVNKLLSEFKNSLFLTASEWTRSSGCCPPRMRAFLSQPSNFGSRRHLLGASVFVALSHGCSSSQSIARVRNIKYENFDVLPTDAVVIHRKASMEQSRLVKLRLLPCDAAPSQNEAREKLSRSMKLCLLQSDTATSQDEFARS